MNSVLRKVVLIAVMAGFTFCTGFCQFRPKVRLTFKIPGTAAEGNYYVMTKDSVKHPYSNIDGFKLIRKKRYVLSENESYAAGDVIAYKAIFKRYGGVKDFVLESNRIDGAMVPKYVVGRINVFDNLQSLSPELSTQTYYLQKGDSGPIVELTKENARTLIYEMLKDYEPSKTIMDKNGNSFKAVEEAVNAYNIRPELGEK